MAHRVEHFGRKGCRGLFCTSVCDQLCPKEHALAANVANGFMFLTERAEPLLSVSTDACSVVGKGVFLELVQHGERSGAGDGIAAECIEIAKRLAKARHDLRARDNAANGVTVGHGFAERDDIGGNPLTFKAPEVQADPPETGLDLIGNEQTTRRAHDPCRFIEPAFGQVWKPLVDEIGANNQRGKAMARGI